MIEVQGLGKRFGARRVLDGLSFSVRRGEVYGLLGPNGCGKSTVVNILCNLLDADVGSAEIAGERVGRSTQRRIGVCPQEIALYRDLRPAENLDFFARLHGVAAAARRRRVAELMHRFGLEPHAGTPVARLSGGWQQRVNIAVALVHDPELLILDEPAAGVDVAGRHELRALIAGLGQAGMTILLTTHHLDDAERLCTRMGIVSSGRIVAEGTLPELLARVPAQAIARVGTRDGEGARARARARGWPTRVYGGELACLLPSQNSLGEVVAAFEGVEVSSVSVLPVALEHAYLELQQGAAG